MITFFLNYEKKLIKFSIELLNVNYKHTYTDKMSRFQKSKGVFIPLTFNGYPDRFILNITKFAQRLLLQEDSRGEYHIPFINKRDVGSYANFKCNKMADKVTELVDQIISHDFPEFCNMRLLLNLFHHCIEEDEEQDFIYHIEDKTIFLFHPDEGIAEKTISKMTEMLEKYLIPHPTVLISDLLSSCAVKLSEEERLMIPCGMQTWLKPIYAKDPQFMKAFSKTLERITKQTVACAGMDFYEVKKICKEIDIKGVYFYITPENVELSGLPFNIKGFSDILKRRLKDHHTEARVLSRK